MAMSHCLVISVHAASHIVMCAFTSFTVAIMKTVLTLPNNSRGDWASQARVASSRIAMAFHELQCFLFAEYLRAHGG
ncbi:hypothetical protein F5882DRAFT_405984 [Hyaloscypha sp. PMI_1271]|nr:hypothetical protein F5882DRAFT_405984 [Hyaloscypha sp. PMI_1271]